MARKFILEHRVITIVKSSSIDLISLKIQILGREVLSGWIPVGEGQFFCLFSLPFSFEAYCYDRGCFFFHQNLVTDHTKIQGHTGGSFFFTRIWSPTLPKFRTYRKVFFFTRIVSLIIPKFRDIQEGLSFSPELCPRPYQN